MTHEFKHEVHLHSAQNTATSIASLLASPDCLHAESPVTDETEQNYLTQLGEALAKNEFDDAAYGQLFTRLEADNLSLAALYRFANLCYQYWQRQWPSASVLQTNQTEIERQAAQLHVMAQGRTLFRRSGTPTRYYWGRTNASGSDATEKGLFFACYPTFAAQGESVKAIYHAELITDVAHIVLCEAHTQVQRRQQSFSQLLRHSSLLHQRLQQHGHHAKVIVNLQLAWLYYRSGPVIRSISIHETGQAVFYFRQAMGEIAHHVFTHQQPPLPTVLTTAAEQLRDVIDQTLLDQAQQALFTAESATLLARWPLCYQEPTLEAIYQLSQQTHALLTHAASVPPAAKQSLREAWLAGFNRSLAGEDEQEVRVAMQSAVSRACNPVQRYPHSLATVHQWLLQMGQQLQQHGENNRARALLHAYQQLLIRRRPNLQSTIASTDQDKAPYIAILATCEQVLTELDQWFKTANLVAETKESKESAALAIKPSAFAERNEQIHTWHQTLAQSLAAHTKTSDIYTANTEFARNLLADICREVEQQIGPAPCAYTLLGAGSFSRGEISPASDLDCALLVAEDTAKTHPWFRCFLQLLQWKLASLPEGILSLENETLAWISKGYWFDTPAGLIEQHLASQQPNNPRSLQQPENFGAQWLRWIYSSENQAPEKDALLRDYQQRLQRFFHAPIDANSLPAYRRLAPWSLAQHVGQAVIPKARTLCLAPPPTQTGAPAKEARETKETKESKHEIKVNSNPASAANTFSVLNVKNLSYRLINAILCYGRFNDVPSGMTTTRDVLAYLKDRQFLPPTFIIRLEIALEQLYTWRLRQHWAWLHHASELGENEVVLWPEDAAQQTAIQTLPPEWRGFYLDKTETQQCQTILNTIAEVIGRSVEGFTTFAAQLLISALDDSPSSSSSVTTTTTIIPDVKETKEAKREVSEEEAQAILRGSSAKKIADPTPSTPPSNSRLFNPIAVALEWTLHQLADSKLPHATQTEHVTWLAHIMGSCATELPVSKPHANDPARVKQDPEFRKHWQVYWAIPTALRSTYIAQLRQSPSIDADAIIEPLRRAPNASGQRLRWLEEQERWQQKILPQLWENKPIAGRFPTAISIVRQALIGGQKQWRVETYPLKPAIREQLFLANGDWQDKNKQHGGNHRVYPISMGGKVLFWVKVHPEQPASEFLVTELDRRLGVEGTPCMELVKFQHGGKTSAAVLTSAVNGVNLQTVVDKVPEQLQQLSLATFVSTLLRVLLTNPEDDKGDDYFLTPQADGSHKLIRIDNERAFFQPSSERQKLLFKSEHLLVKSIVYCLEQMQWQWANDPAVAAVIEDFLRLQPVALVSDLLQTADQLHDGWNQLFSPEEVAAHFNCKDPWTSLPVMCIPNGLARELITRLTVMHTALRMEHTQMTGLQLLKVTQPRLAQYYVASHTSLSSPTKTLLTPFRVEQKSASPAAESKHRASTSTTTTRETADHRRVSARFERVAGHLYQKKNLKDSHSTQHSLMPNSVAMQSSLRLESPVDLATLQKVRSKQTCSAKQQLAEFNQWQKSHRLHLTSDLLAQKATAIVEWQGLPLRQQHLVFTQLDAKQLFAEQKRFILSAMAAVVNETAWPQLNFSGFETALTDALLEPLLKGAGQQLLQLNVSGCTHLTDKSFKILLANNPHLRHLQAQQVAWTTVTLTALPHLEQLDLSGSAVQTLIGEAPSLRSLQLKDCSQLQSLGEIGRLQNSPFAAPQLIQIDLSGCQSLAHLCTPQAMLSNT